MGHMAASISSTVLTIVGYGDLTPKTDLGKLVVAAYAILAVAIRKFSHIGGWGLCM